MAELEGMPFTFVAFVMPIKFVTVFRPAGLCGLRPSAYCRYSPLCISSSKLQVEKGRYLQQPRPRILFERKE